MTPIHRHLVWAPVFPSYTLLVTLVLLQSAHAQTLVANDGVKKIKKTVGS